MRLYLKIDTISQKLDLISRKINLVSQKIDIISQKIKIISPKIDLISQKIEILSVVYAGLTFGPLVDLTFTTMHHIQNGPKVNPTFDQKIYQKPVKLALRLQELFFTRQ